MSNDSVYGCRTIRLSDKIYMRLEDVSHLIRTLGETEETDVRNRCNQLADNIQSLYGYNDIVIQRIPKDYPVRPLAPNQPAKDKATCQTCGLSWDDGISTSITPTPAARCPFEGFHSP
jgi:hypothetical protein